MIVPRSGSPTSMGKLSARASQADRRNSTIESQGRPAPLKVSAGGSCSPLVLRSGGAGSEVMSSGAVPFGCG